jgi:hypothetical protein
MTSHYYIRGEKLDSPMFCNAWLAPDGAMYYVDGECNHDDASCIINNCNYGDCYACSDNMIGQGWLILSKGRSEFVYGNAPLQCIVDDMTQAQRDTLFDLLNVLPSHLRGTRYDRNIRQALGMA